MFVIFLPVIIYITFLIRRKIEWDYMIKDCSPQTPGGQEQNSRQRNPNKWVRVWILLTDILLSRYLNRPKSISLHLRVLFIVLPCSLLSEFSIPLSHDHCDHCPSSSHPWTVFLICKHEVQQLVFPLHPLYHLY